MGVNMIAKLLQNTISAFILSAVLFVAGLVIWFFMRGSGTSFKDILFCIGAIPIVIFAVAQVGDLFGRGDHTVQLSRSVSNQSLHKRAIQDMGDVKSKLKSGLSWFMAGLLVWLYLFLW